jgi:hypothetical protein
VCFVAAQVGFTLGARDCAIELGGADAEVALDRRGDLALRVHQGAAELVGSSDRQELVAGERGGQRANGRLARKRAFKRKPPRWLAKNAPRTVLFREAFLTDPTSRYDELEGRPVAGGLVSVGGAALRLGRSTPNGGLFSYQAGATVRLRVRLSAPARVRVQLTNLTQKDNFHGRSSLLRAGVWSEVDVLLDALVDNAREGKRIAPQDLLGYLSLRADDASVSVELASIAATVR